MKLIIAMLVVIVVLLLLHSMTGNRVTKTKKRDKFRNSSQIGKQNLGKTAKGKSYSELAKDRNLAEAKKIKKKVNPVVTTSISNTTKDIRDTE